MAACSLLHSAAGAGSCPRVRILFQAGARADTRVRAARCFLAPYCGGTVQGKEGCVLCSFLWLNHSPLCTVFC